MCRLRNIAMRDYQESVTTRQADAGQSDPFVLLCFACDTKISQHRSKWSCTDVPICKSIYSPQTTIHTNPF